MNDIGVSWAEHLAARIDQAAYIKANPSAI